MWIWIQILTIYLIYAATNSEHTAGKRQRRYLLFTPSTQWGVFATVSVPLEHPESLVSVAWFFEANYYNVANATYFEPLLGDIGGPTVRRQRSSIEENKQFLTRRSLYIFIETMLERHGYPALCLLRAICENASHLLHGGVLGDLLHLVLTPSSSVSEDDIEDYYYEAEYWGLERNCDRYTEICPENPIDAISMSFE